MAITKYGSTFTDGSNGWKAYITYEYSVSDSYMTITFTDVGVIGTTSSEYTYAEKGLFSGSWDKILFTIADTALNTTVATKELGPTYYRGKTISSTKSATLENGISMNVNKTLYTQNIVITCQIAHKVGISGKDDGDTSTITSDPISLIGLETTTINFLKGDSNKNPPESIIIQKGKTWNVPSNNMTRDDTNTWDELITYTFTGWKLSDSTIDSAAYIANGSYADPGIGDNIYLLPTYSSANKTKYHHSISFDTDGETDVTNMPAQIQGYWFAATTPTTYTIPSEIPVCEGLMFTSWRDSENNVYVAGDSITVPGCTDIILYATWIEAVSILYLDANGGDLQDLSSSYNLSYNASFSIPQDIPVKTGFNFAYWLDDNFNSWHSGDLYKNSSSLYNLQNRLVIPDDNHFTAQWEELSAIIQYNANGGSLDYVPSYETAYYTQQYWITDEIPGRDGYTFLGWSEDSTDTTVQYYEGQLYKNLNVAPIGIKLFAVWKNNNDISEAEIIYNVNGGDLNGITSPQGITYLDAANISSITPIRSGYLFTGWKAKNSATIYQPGDAYKTAESFPAKITLYAQWVLNGSMWLGGDNNIAKKIVNIYIGNSNNIAIPVTGIYVGNSNNKANKIL